MAGDRAAGRREKLFKALREAEIESLLVTNFVNVSYLTGFTGDDSWLLTGPSRTILLSDSRYETQLAEECPGLEVHIRSNKIGLPQALADVLGKSAGGRIAVESGSLTLAQHEKLKEHLPGIEWAPHSGFVETLRQVKDAGEIASIREAVRQAERAFGVMRSTLLPGMTEREAAFDLEHAMRRFGANGAAFPPIIAVGPRAALPHARPTQERIGSSEFVLVDWGATSADGYRSDLTRLLATGRIPPKLEKVYGVVLRAQLRGIRAIRPGVKCRAVDRATRRVIEEAGFGKQFGHGTGHGIGRDIHEGPRLSPVSEDVLEPGMIVTVEPGIYLPGWGGVRIEDDVLVTADGHEVLTSVRKDLDSLPVP